jgi:hypothetical protein
MFHAHSIIDQRNIADGLDGLNDRFQVAEQNMNTKVSAPACELSTLNEDVSGLRTSVESNEQVALP